MELWVILTDYWSLEDVQAALNVVIGILCVMATFTSARWFWQTSVSHVAIHRDVPLPSLLTFTSVGEVIDVVMLARGRLFTWTYSGLAIQCILVVFFCMSAILAGPISRFSSRVGHVAKAQSVPGKMASRSYSCDMDNVRLWEQTIISLNNASFPHDEILDFLPNSSVPWTYQPQDWNNTWKATCESTPKTDMNLTATGNYTKSELYVYDEVPELWNLLDERFRTDFYSLSTYWTGTSLPKEGLWKDLVLWQVAQYRPDWLQDIVDSKNVTQRFSVSIAGVYMKDAPHWVATGDEAGDWNYAFAPGPIPKSYYTQVVCDFERQYEAFNYWEAQPDMYYECGMAPELAKYWGPITMRPGLNGTDDSLPSGDEIMRFYQAFMAVKDTHYPSPNTREIHVMVDTVELSVVFIAVVALVGLAIWTGTVRYFFFWLRHRTVSSSIPETKVDWLLQSLRQAQQDDTEDDWHNARYKLAVGKDLSRLRTMGQVHVERPLDAQPSFVYSAPPHPYCARATFQSGPPAFTSMKPATESSVTECTISDSGGRQ